MSNGWLRESAKDIEGKVLSIGSFEDKDGQEGHYRDYFKSASSYETSDVIPFADLDYVLDVRDMNTIKDGEYDCVFCSGVLEHVEEFGKGVSEITRILKSGGTLLLGVPFRQAIHDYPTDYWRFTKFALEYLFKDKFYISEIKEIDKEVEDFPVAYWLKATKK